MKHTHDHHHTDEKFLNKIEFLDSKQRKRLIPPEDLINQMPIKQNDVLLDVGAGTGFFTIPMAEKTNGKVYAMDPDIRMLGVIEDKAKNIGLNNIELVQEYIENLSIENNSVDFIMASLILHELDFLSGALAKLSEVLKTGGYILCLEYEKDDSIIEGPPMSIRIASERLEKELTLAGFGLVKHTKINEAIYTVLAIKK